MCCMVFHVLVSNGCSRCELCGVVSCVVLFVLLWCVLCVFLPGVVGRLLCCERCVVLCGAVCCVCGALAHLVV